VVQLNSHCVADRQEDELPYLELISRQVSQHGAFGPGVCWLFLFVPHQLPADWSSTASPLASTPSCAKLSGQHSCPRSCKAGARRGRAGLASHSVTGTLPALLLGKVTASGESQVRPMSARPVRVERSHRAVVCRLQWA